MMLWWQLATHISRSGSLMMVMSGCRPTYYPDLSTATFVVTCILSRSRNGDDDVFPHFHSLWISPANKTSKQDSSSGYRVCWATKWQLCQLLRPLPRSFSCSAPTSSTSSSLPSGSKSPALRLHLTLRRWALSPERRCNHCQDSYPRKHISMNHPHSCWTR